MANIYLRLPSFFHQKITILIEQLAAGKVNCKLSITSMISPRILIRECIEGIRTPRVTPRKTTSTRRLHSNFCRGLCAILGQSPIKSRVKRFSFTAHSKSTCRNLNKSKLKEIVA